MRRLVFFLTLLTLAQAQFEDIPPEHWAEGAVLRLTELGVITGFPDGKFHGDQGVTRYEVSLMLSRLWDSWNTESLSEIWSNLVGLETQVTQLQAEREQLGVSLEEMQRRISETETYLVELDSRTADNEEIQKAVETAMITLELLRSELAATQTSLTDLEAAQKQLQTLVETQNTRLDETVSLPDVPDYSADIQTLEDSLSGSLAELETKVLGLDETLTRQINDLSIAVASLIEEKQNAWSATVGLEAGFLGREASYGFSTAFTSPFATLNASMSTSVSDLDISAPLSSSFGVTGQFVSAKSFAGNVGAVVYLSPALSASVSVGVDTGLALTGVLHHAANQQDSFIPGLDVLASVTLAENDKGALERWLFQGSSRYVIDGGSYFITPGFHYRRSDTEDYQLFMPELGGGFLLGDTLVAASVRYGIIQQLSGGGRSVPEGDFTVTLGSGVYTKVLVDGGLPDMSKAASFATGSLLEPTSTQVGVSVGYTIELDELLK